MQMYRGSGRTRLAARRYAVRQVLRCSSSSSSIQLPDTSSVITTDAAIVHTEFTADSINEPPARAQNQPATSSSRPPSFHRLTSTEGTVQMQPSPTAGSALVASSRRRVPWFNAAAVLHDVRPSASYTRQTSSDTVHATVSVDGQHFEGFGVTWRSAKRSAAAQALRRILQLRYLTSLFK